MTMRKEYDLKDGRPNPYAKRLGAAGREALTVRFLESERLVRLAPEVAEVFPTEEAVNEALRLVIQLRELEPRLPVKTAPAAPPRRKRTSGS